MKLYKVRTTGKEKTISFPEEIECEYYFRKVDEKGRVIYTPVGMEE